MMEHSLDIVYSHHALKAIYEFMLEASMVPLISMTERFIVQGHLHDPYQEYFIEEMAHMSKEDLEEDFNSTYWMEKFTMKEDWVPDIFAPRDVKQKILLAGKYVH